MIKTHTQYWKIIAVIFACFSLLLDVATAKEADIELSETEYEGIQLLHWKKKEKTYEINIELPIFTTPTLNEYMKAYMEEKLTDFLEAIDGKVTEKNSGSLYIDANIVKSGIDFYSVVFSESTYTGGANVNQTNTVFVADVEHDRIVEQQNLFQNVSQAREKIVPLVVDALRKDENLDGYLLEDQLEAWATNSDYDFHNMFIDCADEKLGFIFDKYEVAAGVTGMPQVFLPIDEALFSLFKEAWQERMSACKK